MKIIKKDELLAQKDEIRQSFVEKEIERSIKAINSKLEDAIKHNKTQITVELSQNDIEIYNKVKEKILEAGYTIKISYGTDTYIININDNK